MVDYLIATFIGSLCVLCTYHVFNDDCSPLQRIQFDLKDIPSWLKKPIYECQLCMSSIWGTVYMLIINFMFSLKLDLPHFLLGIIIVGGFQVIYIAIKK